MDDLEARWKRNDDELNRIAKMTRLDQQLFGQREEELLTEQDGIDFADCFTTRPDFRPYRCMAVDPRIFDPEKAKDPKDPDYGKARKLPSISMDDPQDMERTLRRGEKETRPN